MDTRFLSHNSHRKNPSHFHELDVHLDKLMQFKYVHDPALLKALDYAPGLYTLTGASLTGKSTLLKRWMAKLLIEGIPAETITYLPGEFIDNVEDLIHLLQTQLNSKSLDITQYVFIDDVTLVRNWDKAIKFVSDIGLLDHTMMMLTSSDKTIGKNLRLLIPRNQNTIINEFKLYPLTFHQSITLKHAHSQITEVDLFQEFNHYLLHGGYLIAMNEMENHGKILDETLKSYSDSLNKQVLKYGKQEHYLREILTAIINHYCRPITWNGLAQELSINHPKTIGDYIALLEALDAVFSQSVLVEETLTAAPKKARKLMFNDPFIFHAIRAWLHHSNENIFATEIKPSVDNSELCTQLAKSCAITHYRHYYPTYYIKAEGEIDLVYVYEQHFWPLVITWTNPLRAKDLKQILKYPNSKILTKALRSGIIEHIRTEPLPQALWKLGEKHKE